MFITKKTFDHSGNNLETLSTDLILEDATDLVPLGTTAANIDILFKVTLPDGDVLHENTDYDNPDIDLDVENSFILSDLPEDTSGYAQEGTYTIQRNTRIGGVLAVDIPIVNAAIPNGFIEVNGEYDVDTTVDIVWSGNAMGGTYPILNVSYVNGRTRISFDGTGITPNLNPLGVVDFAYFEYDQAIDLVTYKGNLPKIKIDTDVNCDFAKLTVSDVSVISGIIVSNTRNFTLKYPDNLPEEIADKLFGTSSFVITDLYAGGTFNVVLERDFTIDVSNNTFYQYSLTAAKDIPVDCSDSLCCIVDCYKNLQNRIYKAGECGDYAAKTSLMNVLGVVTGKIVLANLIRSCSLVGYSDVVSQIKKLLESNDCSCGCEDEKNDGFAYRVYPISELIGGGGSNISITSEDNSLTIVPEVVGETTSYNLQVSADLLDSLQGLDGSTILSGSTAPSTLLGTNGDYYINTTSGALYKKNGTWSVILNLIGQPGQAGAPGVNGSVVTVGGTVPDNGVGENGDLHILIGSSYKLTYERVAGVWTLVGNLQDYFRQRQNNVTQNPILANTPDVPFIYLDGKDVAFNSSGGNTYIASFIQKKTADATTTMPVVDGEEFRFINIGDANVIFENEGTVGDPAGGANRQMKNVDGENLIVPPSGAVTFKFIDTGSTSYFYVVSKNF